MDEDPSRDGVRDEQFDTVHHSSSKIEDYGDFLLFSGVRFFPGSPHLFRVAVGRPLLSEPDLHERVSVVPLLPISLGEVRALPPPFREKFLYTCFSCGDSFFSL